MLKALSFRQKILISQLLLFFLFIVLLFPIIEQMVKEIVRDSLEERVENLIEKINLLSSEKEMIDFLKDQELFVFFRITLVNERQELLYDELIRKREPTVSKLPFSRPEVEQALQEGIGYREGFSRLFNERFVYVAVAFPFQGAKYVLRAGFPFIQVQELTQNFEIGFLFLF